MCKNCCIVKSVFEGATSNPSENLKPVHAFLNELIKCGRLEVYAGDCGFGEMIDVLSEDRHFTVSFYLECPDCGKMYFFGACIRGTPKYKEADSDDLSRIEKILWGREGKFFN